MEENLQEFERTSQALELMVKNCLLHTPTRNGFSHLNQWYAEHRTIRFHGPRQSGKTTAVVTLAKKMSFCPLFLVPNGLQKDRLKIKFSLTSRVVYTFKELEQAPNLQDADWIIIDDPFNEFSTNNLQNIYRQFAPGLQLVILVN
jgi:hypothetical protein